MHAAAVAFRSVKNKEERETGRALKLELLLWRRVMVSTISELNSR